MRFHTNLPVRDIEQTVRFYRELLGAEPVKQRDDYAKFLPEGVALNLSFHVAPEAVEPLRALHLGFELPDKASLDAAHERLRRAGLIAQERETGVCCYARQDKLWVEDPNGYRWELYLLLEDTEHKMDRETQCCAPAGDEAQAPGCC